MLDPALLREALQHLRMLDPGYSLFGARAHRYLLNPPLPEEEIAAVERRYRMSLPADYRLFLGALGNGGAGPAYGLFKLGEEDDGSGHRPWARGRLLGDPSRPFRHTAAWNLPPEFWAEEPQEGSLPEEALDRALRDWDARLKQAYAPSLMDGALPICHLGCALRQWLVVSGPAAGQIWNDDRADRGGISPLLDREGAPVDFAGWYEGWLRDSLRELRSRAS